MANTGAGSGVPGRDRLQELVEEYFILEKPQNPPSIADNVGGLAGRVGRIASAWVNELTGATPQAAISSPRQYIKGLAQRVREDLAQRVDEVRGAVSIIGTEAKEAVYTGAQEGMLKAGGLQLGTIQYILDLDSRTAESLQSVAAGSPNRAMATREARRLERELGKIGEALTHYQEQITEAIAAGDHSGVAGLVSKVREVLDINRGVMSGKYMPKGASKDARAALLGSEALSPARVKLDFAVTEYEFVTALAGKAYGALSR